MFSIRTVILREVCTNYKIIITKIPLKVKTAIHYYGIFLIVSDIK